MPLLIDTSTSSFSHDFETLLQQKRAAALDVRGAVHDILARVQHEGDQALIDLTQAYDQHTLTHKTLSLNGDRRQALCEQVSDQAAKALELAAERIRRFHERQRPQDHAFTDETGARLGWTWRPLSSVGLYVPGGLAAYPSSVLMNAIPARIAGVERLVMVVPAPQGILSPLVIFAAHLAKVDDIYPIGGAQAVGALAFGTKTVPEVDKIVGPGNAYVAEAKRQVFGRVGIDMVAGPSEVVIYAEASANPEWLAMDLLAQAEHDEAAQSILITPSNALAQAVADHVKAALDTLPRREIARQSWNNHGALIVVNNRCEAVNLINQLAPEHLQLIAPEARDMIDDIKAVGAVFIGDQTPEAIGDYVAGTNHVLPTSRTARFSSGLGVLDFMTRFSTVEMSQDSLRAIGEAGAVIADCEGLDAHAKSIRLRLDANEEAKKVNRHVR